MNTETKDGNITEIKIKNLKTRILALGCLILLSLFIYYQYVYFLGPLFQEIFHNLEIKKGLTIAFFMKNLWTPIISYILIGFWFILLTLVLKGKIKKYDENGLIVGLISCLISGLIVDLIFGLIVGLIDEFQK